MQDRLTVRRLSKLANRLSKTAEAIRNARVPHQLTLPRKRALRHLKELNLIRDFWSDHFKATRIKRNSPPRFLCECQTPSYWRKRRSLPR